MNVPSVRQRVQRGQAEDVAGLYDRSASPHYGLAARPAALVLRITVLRQQRWTCRQTAAHMPGALRHFDVKKP